MQNLDHGLWQGMLIEDVRRKQPKVYRQWQEQPETVCPPEGEMLSQAEERIRTAMAKTAEAAPRRGRGAGDARTVGHVWCGATSSTKTSATCGRPRGNTRRWEVLELVPASPSTPEAQERLTARPRPAATAGPR